MRVNYLIFGHPAKFSLLSDEILLQVFKFPAFINVTISDTGKPPHRNSCTLPKCAMLRRVWRIHNP